MLLPTFSCSPFFQALSFPSRNAFCRASPSLAPTPRHPRASVSKLQAETGYLLAPAAATRIASSLPCSSSHSALSPSLGGAPPDCDSQQPYPLPFPQHRPFSTTQRSRPRERTRRSPSVLRVFTAGTGLMNVHKRGLSSPVVCDPPAGPPSVNGNAGGLVPSCVRPSSLLRTLTRLGPPALHG